MFDALRRSASPEDPWSFETVLELGPRVRLLTLESPDGCPVPTRAVEPA